MKEPVKRRVTSVQMENPAQSGNLQETMRNSRGVLIQLKEISDRLIPYSKAVSWLLFICYLLGVIVFGSR